MAEYCGTLQSKTKRNREYEACLDERAILLLLDYELSNNSDVLQLVGRVPFVRLMGWWDRARRSHQSRKAISVLKVVCLRFAFLHDTRYRFLAVYVESNILVHDGLFS